MRGRQCAASRAGSTQSDPDLLSSSLGSRGFISSWSQRSWNDLSGLLTSVSSLICLSCLLVLLFQASKKGREAAKKQTKLFLGNVLIYGAFRPVSFSLQQCSASCLSTPPKQLKLRCVMYILSTHTFGNSLQPSN